ncbi:MAG TPA: ABC transporter ATP-binding protein [Thermoplasmata archaeon]|nr:ABC transporter ATP-binding protein [Thermoplasmata archaeon]
MSDPVILAESVTKRYGEVLGLNGFSAAIGPGITGLIGPNGAGKSTLYRLLVGQLKADAGNLRVFGHTTWGEGEFRRRVGYCPEHSALFEWMSGRDFVTSLLRVDGFSKADAEERAARAITAVSLLEAQDRRLGTYSKGMRQRIKLAQSIAHDPELILLDEPLNGVDPLGRAAVITLLRRLQQAGHHVLVSSHVLYEVERLTDQIVMISNGRAIAQGDLHRIRSLIDAHPHVIELETPDPRRVARVLGSMEHVVSIEFPGGNRLRVRSRSPEEFYRTLPGLVVQEGLDIQAVGSTDDNLDAVFRYLSEGSH